MGCYNESFKHSYHWLKQRGICVQCGKEYAEPGKIHCFDCAEYFRVKNKEYLTPDRRTKNLEKDKERREKRKKAGLCIQCGKKAYTKNGHTYTLCYEHYIESKARDRRYREKKKKKWKEQGLCSWCGSDRKNGYNLCQECYEKLMERQKKGSELGSKVAKENREKEGHPWLRYQPRARSVSENTEKSSHQNGL